MRRLTGALACIACVTSGCAGSAHSPAAATPTPTPTKLPAGPTTPPSAGTRPTSGPFPTPFTEYSQEHVGNGEYQLLNNFTYQFVSATANGVTRRCGGGGGAACTDYVKIGITEYSGNTQVRVSPKQYVLVSSTGARYAPAAARQAAPVVQSSALLTATVLQPDDDGDYASGTLVFLTPVGPGRFSLTWKGHHVATFVKTARGALHETR